MSLLEIDSNYILEINSTQLVKLIKHLLIHETKKFGIPNYNINCSLNVNARDEAADARVK